MRTRPQIKLSRSRFFRRSAIVLLTTAMILSLFLAFFQMFQNPIIQALSQMNNEFIEQVDTILGTILDIINNTAMQMFYSHSVRTLRTATELTNAQRVAGIRELGNLVSSSTFLSSAMIYNPNMDYIFTSEGGYSSDLSGLFHDKTAANLIMSRTTHGSTAPVKAEIEGEECYSFLFFESTVPDGGSLLLNVRADWYEDRLLGMSSGCDSIIFDENGRPLVVGGKTPNKKIQQIWTALLEGFDSDRGHGYVLSDGGKSGWLYYRLSSLGWYYLRSFNTETLLPGITKIRNVVLGSLIVVFVLLIGGILYTLVVFYEPTKEVKKEQLFSEQMELLLSGEEDDFITYPASLILTDTANSGALRQVVSSQTVAPSLVAKSDPGSAIVISGCSEAQVLELCLSISHNLGCRCLYGSPRESGEELAECQNNLLEIWQLRFLHVGQQVLSEKLIIARPPTPEFQTKDAEPLFAAPRAGQLAEARTMWKGIFEQIRQGRFGDFLFTVSYLFKRLDAYQTELGLQPFSYSTDIVDDLEDVRQLHRLLDDAFVEITSAQEELHKQELNQLATRINARIEAGYHDEALSAQSIADEMGMNAVYLGRLYRESTGISIGEAIKRTRVEKAKQLLLSDTSRSVKSVAMEVGFANTKYFFVVFKDLVGMTPGEFQGKEH